MRAVALNFRFLVFFCWLIPPLSFSDGLALNVSGEYTQIRKEVGLERPVISEGYFLSDANKGVLFKELGNQGSFMFLSVDGGVLRWSGSRWEEGSSRSVSFVRDFFSLVLGQDRTRIKKSFTIEQENIEGKRVEIFSPKRRKIAKFVKRIEVVYLDMYLAKVVLLDTQEGSFELQFTEHVNLGAVDEAVCESQLKASFEACQEIYVSSKRS